jgi:hypothetical protein
MKGQFFANVDEQRAIPRREGVRRRKSEAAMASPSIAGVKLEAAAEATKTPNIAFHRSPRSAAHVIPELSRAGTVSANFMPLLSNRNNISIADSRRC